MDILIPHSWLKDYLKTAATPAKIAEYLSLCGPSVERMTKQGKDIVYSIEVTTNRIDSASVYGIAREAVAILPRFKVKAELLPIKTSSNQKLVTSVEYLDIEVDKTLCPRFTAVLIRDVRIAPSAKYIQERLKLVGMRPINNIVDISNYLMIDLGQPMHTFDHDKILGKKMILRESREGETITTLDGKEHTLPGGDIVIEDGEGRLIDLAGIMGGKLSSVDENTKNVLLFVQTYNPAKIRQTSMKLAHRTNAAGMFEKGIDPEGVEIAIRRAIDLFVEECKGIPEKEILDIYPNPYSVKSISTSTRFINERLGISISTSDVKNILESLNFPTALQGETLQIQIPSYRANDISIPEDIVEEIARLYGYHNLPSQLMSGLIPDPLTNSPFEFEMKVKQLIKGWGGIEVYTYSMTSLENADLTHKPSWVLKIKNPLGTDGEYMRLSLAPSLIQTVKQNLQEKDLVHLFEVANVYLPVRASLPEEKMTLAGIFSKYEYRSAKGIIEALLEELVIETTWSVENFKGFKNNTSVAIKVGKQSIGKFGILETEDIYYEFDMAALQANGKTRSFTPIPKFPPQVEDITLEIPKGILLGDVIKTIKKSDQQIVSIELIDSFKQRQTMRVFYQNPKKTLTDKEVEGIRKKVINTLSKKFGVKQV